MNKLFSLPLLALALLISLPCHAVGPAGQRYIDELANGGAISMRDAAKSIYNTGERDQQVLDALAEALLENEDKTDRDYVDATAWACRALGNSSNPRYHDTLKEVADHGAHRKLRKYAEKALNQLGGGGSAVQYKKGGISLKAAAAAAPAQTHVKKSSGLQPITVVKVGMSMQEVYELVGQPTATTSHQTGKAWIPFNYKGGDDVRTIALYKGQGRVVFSNESRYSSGWRVREVQLNKNESGYP